MFFFRLLVDLSKGFRKFSWKLYNLLMLFFLLEQVFFVKKNKTLGP